MIHSHVFFSRARRAGLGIAIGVAIVGLGWPAVAQQSAATEIQNSARFELPTDPNQVVVSMTEHIHQLVMPTYPSVRVYSDGRVVRHVPVGFKHPGDYESRITLDEVTALVQSLSERGVLGFDSRSAQLRKGEIDRAQGLRHYRSDPTTIEIEVRLASYAPGTGVAPTADFAQTVSWTGLQFDAERYPDLTQIQNLAASFRLLEELAHRTQREGRVGGGS